jgi:splicing factor U2AF subunit
MQTTVRSAIPFGTGPPSDTKSLRIINVSPGVTQSELTEFLNGAIMTLTKKALLDGSPQPVEKALMDFTENLTAPKSCRVHFRTPETAAVCMKLHGIPFKGYKLSIMRPPGYREPHEGDPYKSIKPDELKMPQVIGLWVPDDASSTDRLTISGVPHHLTDEQIQEFIQQFGMLKMLSLLRDDVHAYGFLEFEDAYMTDFAQQCLHGMVVGGAQIKVEKLAEQKNRIPTATPSFQSMKRLVESNPIWSMQLRVGKQMGLLPSPVVQILNMVFHEDLIDDEDYQAILNECREEASKLGRVLDIVIPRPDKVDQTKAIEGVGKCFVHFEDITCARKFHAEVNGRKFDNRTMCVAFYPVDSFQKKEYVLRGNQ